MARKTVFVKVSGDMLKNASFLTWLEGIAHAQYVTLCIGGGTQINEEFARRGLPVTKHGPLGRETGTLEERQIARNVLEQNAAKCEDELESQGIHARVFIPVLEIGGVLCHVNGDQMVRTAYLGYDELVVITTPDRLEKKQMEFKDLPKVLVYAFE